MMQPRAVQPSVTRSALSACQGRIDEACTSKPIREIRLSSLMSFKIDAAVLLP